MFNPTSVAASAFGDYLEALYTQYFSGRKPEYAAYIGGAARLVLERLGNTDALYHNAEHTMMVTLVGQAMLRGRILVERRVDIERPRDLELTYTAPFQDIVHELRGHIVEARK